MLVQNPRRGRDGMKGGTQTLGERKVKSESGDQVRWRGLLMEKSWELMNVLLKNQEKVSILFYGVVFFSSVIISLISFNFMFNYILEYDILSFLITVV